jgi:hypothetical protein
MLVCWLHTLCYVTDTPDEQTGGDSSKSNSITSEHSLHSVGVSASSQSSSTNSLPPSADGNDTSYPPSMRNRHKVHCSHLVELFHFVSISL